MDFEIEIQHSLHELNLPLNSINEKTFSQCLKDHLSPLYTQIISLLSIELQKFLKLEEHINPIDEDTHKKAFILEVSSFLKEIGSPYKSLLEGSIESRLSTYDDRIKLLGYLISELQASKITMANNSEEIDKGVKLSESPEAQQIRLMLLALAFPKPPVNITTTFLFTKVLQKISEIISVLGPQYLGQPLFTSQLSASHWHELSQLADEMGQEYRMRKELLLTRVDVTVDSFTWSERLKDKKGLIAEKYGPKRQSLVTKTDINVADLLSARDDLLIYDKTSDTNVLRNTKSQINKVLIGKVPDRGGRPSESQAPPPEVPSYMKTDSSHGNQGHFNSHRGRGRGAADGGHNKVHGGWESNDRRHDNRSHHNPQHNAEYSRPTSHGTWYGGESDHSSVGNQSHQFTYNDNNSGRNNRGRGGFRPVSDFSTYNNPNGLDDNSSRRGHNQRRGGSQHNNYQSR